MAIVSTAATGASRPAQAAVPNDPKLRDACRQFEGQFYSLMLQEMQKTVPSDPEIADDAHEQQIFQGMMNDAIAQKMAKVSAGPTDLAEQMYLQLVHADTLAGGGHQAAEAAVAGASRTVNTVSTQIGSTEDETK